MKQAVFKYRIEPGRNALDLPVGAHLVHVAEQQPDEVYLWALVDPHVATAKRVIVVMPTGEPREVGVHPTYIGTFHMRNGLVFHTFEVTS